MGDDPTPTAETYQDSYKNYADYNGVLRTWFVSFGLGALVLFMLHPDFVSLLRGRGHFSWVVNLFLIGCFAQVGVALINKFSSWHIYDAAKKGVTPGRITDFFYNAFWIDKAIDVGTAACFVVAIWLMVSDFVVTPTQASVQPADFELERICSEASAKFFQRAGFDQKASDFYKNHWNGRQKKCFIQINAPRKDNFIMVDVYDVFENRRYAAFNGHQVCDPAIVGERACQLDNGTVWMDGDDERVNGDYNFGFNGAAKHSVGNSSTRTDFLARIRTFMVD